MLPNLRFQAPTSPSAPASASILAPSMPRHRASHSRVASSISSGTRARLAPAAASTLPARRQQMQGQHRRHHLHSADAGALAATRAPSLVPAALTLRAGLSNACSAPLVAATLPSLPRRRRAPAIAGIRQSLGRRRYERSLATVAPRLPPCISHARAGNAIPRHAITIAIGGIAIASPAPIAGARSCLDRSSPQHLQHELVSNSNRHSTTTSAGVPSAPAHPQHPQH